MAVRGAWKPHDLEKALNWILTNKYATSDAARAFGMSRATIYRAIHRRTDQPSTRKKTVKQPTAPKVPMRERLDRAAKSRPQPNAQLPVIMPIAESVMVQQIQRLHAENYIISPQDLKKLCFLYCQDNPMYPSLHGFDLRRHRVSNQWYLDFLKRHPEIKPILHPGKRHPVQVRPSAAVAAVDSDSSIAGNISKESPCVLDRSRSRARRRRRPKTVSTVNTSKAQMAPLRDEHGKFLKRSSW